MADTPARLAEKLQIEGAKSLEFFQALTPEQWQVCIYTEGMEWNTRQLFSHFVSTELAIQTLIQGILAGGDGAPEDFDINQFNDQKAVEMEFLQSRDLLDRFAAARQVSINLIKQMQPEDLYRTGRHPFLGVVPLEDMLKLLYRHNQIHQRDVRKILFPQRGE
jgi:hypothetical protein